MAYIDPIQRFWEKVDRHPEGCWGWRGSRRGAGYGVLWWKGDDRAAHRVSWEIANGPIPDGMWVLHHCDNPPCVNPDHLFLGTISDNVRDMDRKGRRGVRGVLVNTAKLTEAEVRAIRERHAAGESFSAIARSVPVSRRTIQNLVKRRSWRHVL